MGATEAQIEAARKAIVWHTLIQGLTQGRCSCGWASTSPYAQRSQHLAHLAEVAAEAVVNAA